mgnify:CR=1 FL=1
MCALNIGANSVSLVMLVAIKLPVDLPRKRCQLPITSRCPERFLKRPWFLENVIPWSKACVLKLSLYPVRYRSLRVRIKKWSDTVFHRTYLPRSYFFKWFDNRGVSRSLHRTQGAHKRKCVSYPDARVEYKISGRRCRDIQTSLAHIQYPASMHRWFGCLAKIALS